VEKSGSHPALFKTFLTEEVKKLSRGIKLNRDQKKKRGEM